MSDQKTPEEIAAEEAEAARVAAEAEAEGQEPEGNEQPATIEQLTEENARLRAEVQRVRGEAANYRVRLREAEGRLAEAKTPEEYEAALEELRQQNAQIAEALAKSDHAVLVEKIARKHKLPDKLAARLKGDTAEELEADAKELAEFVEPEVELLDPDALNGGLDGGKGGDGLPNDPRALRGKRR